MELWYKFVNFRQVAARMRPYTAPHAARRLPSLGRREPYHLLGLADCSRGLAGYSEVDIPFPWYKFVNFRYQTLHSSTGCGANATLHGAARGAEAAVPRAARACHDIEQVIEG